MTTLFIDVGMTLLGGPNESPATFICNLLGIPLENKRIVSRIVFCRDVTSSEELVDLLKSELEVNIKDAQSLAIRDFWDSQMKACQPLEGAKAFCDDIIALGIDYYIVSNLWPPFYDALKAHLNAFANNANGLFLSYKIGSCKPSDEFYSYVYSAVSVPAKDILMIGDSMNNDMKPCIERGSTGILLSMNNNPRSCPQTELKRLVRVKSHAECLSVIKAIHKGNHNE